MSRISIQSALTSNYKIHFCCLYFLFFGLITEQARAQVTNSGEVLRAGTEDASLLLKEYLKPFGRGFGANLNTGWFSSARPLQTFGVDLRVSVSTSFVPSKDQFFDVTNLDLRTVKVINGPTQTPTIFGDDTETSILGSTQFNSSTQQEEEFFSFEMPKGSGYHIVPSPMAQFSLGLPGHTQVILRYSPEVVIENDYKLSIFGIGGMVGLNQLLFRSHLPIDISLQAGTLNLNADAPFNVRPETNANIENPYPDTHWDGQAIGIDSKTFTANIIVGKEFSILSLFGGAGYQHSSTNISIKGPYPVVAPMEEDNMTANSSATKEIQSINAPINFSLDGVNKVHLLGGLQLKLGFISISADYTYAEYSTFRTGLGITFNR